ncbi:uncharacterized protein SOCE26_078840 [Sorangium cellulosum]|uniref:Uncharacterized protein n=1 Tax=Sorangium cellulosum TaxID=56 RepID=A0A2L0F472_SORCE|nr:hypothetical protein [Sorangium cellulosum]AUX46378.1 uncharacterized protein SOCE26_078840 [Sorangium cellulosum]
MSTKSPGPISFDLHPDHQKAIETLAGNRTVRLSGAVKGGKLVVNFIACNAAFIACNQAFAACNQAFTACNQAFTACNSAFKEAK